jgi:hypothetical protein
VPITPDTKDWTWVLQRPCPECGFDVSQFRRDDVGSMIRANAAVWQKVLARPDLDRRPDDQTWSPLEYACHVRDVFRIYDHRLELMLTTDDPAYPNWDQDASAADEQYNKQDPAVVAAELQAAAHRFAERFDGVVGRQWDRTGTRSDGASFTVESLARYMMHDPVHHLYDVGIRVE